MKKAETEMKMIFYSKRKAELLRALNFFEDQFQFGLTDAQLFSKFLKHAIFFSIIK